MVHKRIPHDRQHEFTQIATVFVDAQVPDQHVLEAVCRRMRHEQRPDGAVCRPHAVRQVEEVKKQGGGQAQQLRFLQKWVGEDQRT